MCCRFPLALAVPAERFAGRPPAHAGAINADDDFRRRIGAIAGAGSISRARQIAPPGREFHAAEALMMLSGAWRRGDCLAARGAVESNTGLYFFAGLIIFFDFRLGRRH